jgi:hypothetical protein
LAPVIGSPDSLARRHLRWVRRVSGSPLAPVRLVLNDVTTFYFKSDGGDGFRKSGLSKERLLEPQITIGVLTVRYASYLFGPGVPGRQ